MAHATTWGEGAIVSALPSIVDDLAPRSILLVSGGRAVAASGLGAELDRVLNGHDVIRFGGFHTNPRIEDVRRGVALLREHPVDAVIAVGGGTALDLGKLISVLAAQQGDPEPYIKKERDLRHPRRQPLILVPTTSGTGSEMTRFGVVYIGTKKYSLDHAWLMAEHAIVDPQLTWSMSGKLTAATGLDCLAQAMESFWCVRSTAEARNFAVEAMTLTFAHIEDACLRPSPAARAAMSRAAMLAGQAIDITRTTAAHAVSYPITALFGVPHGHACALTLPEFLVFNSEVGEEDVLDPRGTGFARARLRDLLDLMGVATPEAGRNRLRELIAALGLEVRLSDLGIPRSGIACIIREAFNPDRVNNNPRRLSEDGLKGILARIA